MAKDEEKNKEVEGGKEVPIQDVGVDEPVDESLDQGDPPSQETDEKEEVVSLYPTVPVTSDQLINLMRSSQEADPEMNGRFSKETKLPYLEQNDKNEYVDTFLRDEKGQPKVVEVYYQPMGEYAKFLDGWIKVVVAKEEKQAIENDVECTKYLKDLRVKADLFAGVIFEMVQYETHAEATLQMRKAFDSIESARRWIGKMLAFVSVYPYKDVEGIQDVIDRPDKSTPLDVAAYWGDKENLPKEDPDLLLRKLQLLRNFIASDVCNQFNVDKPNKFFQYIATKTVSVEHMVWRVYMDLSDSRMYLGEAIGAHKA